MSFATTRQQRRQLERENAKLPDKLHKVPVDQWPSMPEGLVEVWRSKEYLVQIYQETFAGVLVRLTVNRTQIYGDRWKEDVPWDDLQRLKRECGYGDKDAVEVFPRDKDVVNVANMRHLWVMREPLLFAWRKCERIL